MPKYLTSPKLHHLYYETQIYNLTLTMEIIEYSIKNMLLRTCDINDSAQHLELDEKEGGKTQCESDKIMLLVRVDKWSLLL